MSSIRVVIAGSMLTLLAYSSAASARYLTPDPIGAVPGVTPMPTGPESVQALQQIPLQQRLLNGLNHAYVYVDNNPARWIDLNGLTKITFDPKKGILIVDPEVKDRLPYNMPASSGRKDCACDSTKKNEGPIPSGNYALRSSELSDPGVIGDIARNLLGDWGDWRVPLHPQPGTKTRGRSGFLLHGGAYPGSAGCIDVGGGVFGNSLTDQLLQDILNDPDGNIPVSVK